MIFEIVRYEFTLEVPLELCRQRRKSFFFLGPSTSDGQKQVPDRRRHQCPQKFVSICQFQYRRRENHF